MSAGSSAQRKADEVAAEVVSARERVRQLERSQEAWARGALGERVVAQELARSELDGRVLHDRLLHPGSSEVNLDHVVITRAGVFVLDAKYWTGDLTVHKGMLWVHRTTPQGRRHFAQDRELAKVGGYADTMAPALSVQVHPVVVLASAAHSGFRPQVVAGVNVVPVGKLRSWLEAWPAVLDDDQRRDLGQRCAQSFPATGGDASAGGLAALAHDAQSCPSAPHSAGPPRQARRRARQAKVASRTGRKLLQVLVLTILLVLLLTQAGRLGSMLSWIFLEAVGSSRQ